MNKTYIITDPSYILTQDEWFKCCKILDTNKNYSEVQEQFNLKVQMKLKDVSGDNNAWCNDTLIGDWTNSIHGPDIIQSEFAADAGMVCICEYTDEVQRRISTSVDGKPLPISCYGLFKANGPLSITEDEVSDQLQLYIHDSTRCEWTLDNPKEEEE